jgi:hypothetical protein
MEAGEIRVLLFFLVGSIINIIVWLIIYKKDHDPKDYGECILGCILGSSLLTMAFALELIGWIIMSDDDNEVFVQRDDFKNYSVEKLNDLLKDAIDKEDYERAAKIRDELAVLKCTYDR